MQQKLPTRLKKKKDEIKIQIQRNQAENTEYADDLSSDNIYSNDDEKRECEDIENSNMLSYNLESYDLAPHPLDNSSCCNRLWQTMSSFWVLSLIKLGSERAIKISDLYQLPKSESLSNTLIKWQETIDKYKYSSSKLSIISAIWNIEKGDIIFVFMLNLIRALIIIGLLYLWQFLIAFYTDPDVPIASGILLALYMFILNLCRSTINSIITNCCSSMGTRMMGMIMSIMYDKGLEMDLESSKKQASLNIIGSNLEYIGWGLLYLPSSMIFAIILIIVSFLFLYIIVGYCSYIGICFVLFIGIPCQIFVLLRISDADDNRFDTSDMRVSFMNDLFHGVKFTKLYSWEIPLMNRINKYRNKERTFVESYNTNLAWLRLINFAIPTLMLVIIVVYYLLQGHKLHLFIMFQLIIVAQILSGAIDMIPIHALFATEFIVALQRIDQFLNIENKKCMIKDTESNINKYIQNNITIKITNGDFEWNKNDNDNDTKYGLKNINMEVKRGELIAIIGKVGSGKSSLLQTILGEMNMLSGKHYINGTNNGNKNNVISYVPQSTFILHGTVRDNILLGLEYNAIKYKKVIKFSALEQDLKVLPQQDLTVIGEQGVTISGGQKMRISFARALYRCNNSDIFLFDDPLSSVDIDVGQIMFTNGIQKLLKNKTRIIVMNSHLFYLKYFDKIYVLNKNDKTNQSTIIVKATYNELVNNYQQFKHLMPSTFNYNNNTTNEEKKEENEENKYNYNDNYNPTKAIKVTNV
eukprot:308969_1